MEEFLRVGVISSTHGIKGEVKVYPTTDDTKRFDDLKEVWLDTGREKIALNVTGVKYFKNMVILKFKEFNDINEIEKYKGCDLLVDREHAIELEEGEYFIADLIGLEVYTDTGERFGILEDVMQTGANDVYIVKTEDGKEVLLPVIPECILKVDLDEGRVLVHIMDGLL